MTTRIAHQLIAVALALFLGASPSLAKNPTGVSTALAPTFGTDSGASGKATYARKGSNARFTVAVEGLPMGTYDLYVNSAKVGDFTVTPDGLKTRGAIAFDTKRRSKVHRLNFDPRGKAIEVYNGLVVVLAGVLPGAPPDRVYYSNYAATLVGVPMGDTPGTGRPARGSLKIRSNKNSAWVHFELQRLAQEPHTLTANDVAIASITPGPGGFARVEFSTDPGDGDRPLDFDPAGVTYRFIRDADGIVALEFVSDPGTIGGGLAPVRRIDSPLFGTGIQPMAMGHSSLTARGAKLDFTVQIEGVVPGPYVLRINGDSQGPIEVSMSAEVSVGFVELSNYRSGIGIGPLSLDPRGKKIDILAGGVIVLTTVFPNG